MRTRWVALLALCLVTLGLIPDVKPPKYWQWRGMGQVWASDGNPVTFEFQQDPCAALNAQHALLLAVSADFLSPDSDQVVFQLGGESSYLRLDLAATEFHILRMIAEEGSRQSIEVIGRQSWRGTRDFILVLKSVGLLEVLGGGLDTRAAKVVIPRSCPSLVVGGAVGEGDFQGRVKLSYTVLPSEGDLQKLLESLGPLNTSESSPWSSLVILAGIVCLFFLGTKTLNRCREVEIDSERGGGSDQ